MKAGHIRLRARPGEIEIAVIVAGQLADYALWRPGRPDGFGDLHLGRVTRRVPALGGCFVTLADEACGFLPDRECDAPPPEGAPVRVRLIRASLGTKGPRLSMRAAGGGAEAGEMRRLAAGPSPLADLRAVHPTLPVTAADPHLAATCGAELRRDDIDATEPADEAIATLAARTLVLPGGMRATIEPTATLVAIDLDTAAASEATGRRDTALFAANRDAMPRLLHEIRLRNLSGAIVIDAAGLPARKRAAFAPVIAQALAADPLRPRLLGFSALGFAEIVRARRRPALHELRASLHGRAIDAGAALAQAAAGHRSPLCLVAAPALAHEIERDRALGEDLARATGRPLILRTDARLPAASWRIEELDPS